jgi:hypothetical protein
MTPSNSRPTTFASLRVIWIALTCAPVAYVVISFAIRSDGTFFSLPNFASPLELMMTLVAVGSATASFFVPRLVAVQNRFDATELSAMTDDQVATAAAVPMIVRWSQIEAIAICGFIIVTAGAPASRIVPFAAISFALIALCGPTRERVEAMLG